MFIQEDLLHQSYHNYQKFLKDIYIKFLEIDPRTKYSDIPLLLKLNYIGDIVDNKMKGYVKEYNLINTEHVYACVSWHLKDRTLDKSDPDFFDFYRIFDRYLYTYINTHVTSKVIKDRIEHPIDIGLKVLLDAKRINDKELNSKEVCKAIEKMNEAHDKAMLSQLFKLFD